MRQTIKIIVSVTAMASLFFQHGCKDKGTEPVPPKNPREFTWTVDTLIAHPDAIQTQMRDIYATSPQNVYVVGHTDWTGVNGNGIMWRYDGTSWSIVNEGFRDMTLSSISGFGPSNIYAAGSKGQNALILHFDGTSWRQTTLPGNPLFAIRGGNPSNIWTGGWMGTTFHFDGAQWLKVSLDNSLSIQSLAIYDGTAYATAYRPSDQFPADSIWNFFLRWDGTQWDTLDMYLETGQTFPQTFGSLLSVVGGELYSGGGNIFRFVSGKWEKIFSGPYAGPVAGPSPDNIFSVGFRGTVYHFNGNDWFQFKQFISSEFHFGSVWFDGREVFIVGGNASKTIVLHGK